MKRLLLVSVVLTLLCPASLSAADPRSRSRAIIGHGRGDRMITDYFRKETEKLASRSLANIRTLADWQARRGKAGRSRA